MTINPQPGDIATSHRSSHSWTGKRIAILVLILAVLIVLAIATWMLLSSLASPTLPPHPKHW